ncbi:MAG: hypothetical protein V8Q38_02195 [Alistipes putredinis]
MKFKKFIIPALCMAMLSAGCSGQDPVTPVTVKTAMGVRMKTSKTVCR